VFNHKSFSDGQGCLVIDFERAKADAGGSQRTNEFFKALSTDMKDKISLVILYSIGSLDTKLIGDSLSPFELCRSGCEKT
jgi:hypothetical protein